MLKNNILLANFLGLELQDDGTYFDYESNEYININDLNYNTSWDMLMLVVSKILETDKIELSADITKVYEQCVEFIEWWNKNN